MQNAQADSRTNQVAIKVDDLQGSMAAGNVRKLPDRLLMLLGDAHSPQVELYQGSAGCQAWAQLAQALTAQWIPLHQVGGSSKEGSLH